MWLHFKRVIFAGVFAIIPIALTIYIFVFLFKTLDNLTAPLLKTINLQIPGLGIVLSLVLVYLLGLFVRNILGRRLFSWGEKIFLSIPIVNTIYKTIKQLVGAFSGTTGSKNFQKVIYLEYPRKEIWTLAFVTGDSIDADGVEYYHVFVPTTPNPTSGVFIIIQKKDTLLADMTVEKGLKTVISGGILASKENILNDFPGNN